MHLLMEIINASSPCLNYQTVILRCATFSNMYSVIMYVEMSGIKCRQAQQLSYAITLNKLIPAHLLRTAISWTKYVGEVLKVLLN
jgi:hypothetical protein